MLVLSEQFGRSTMSHSSKPSLQGRQRRSRLGPCRYSRAAKDWGWREFVTLTSLFDQDAGFLVNDTVIFSAEVPSHPGTGATHNLSLSIRRCQSCGCVTGDCWRQQPRREI